MVTRLLFLLGSLRFLITIMICWPQRVKSARSFKDYAFRGFRLGNSSSLKIVFELLIYENNIPTNLIRN